MSNVRSNFYISFLSSNVVMVINFVGSMFLARLLTPNEIGIFSVAYVFAGLLRTIREMGLGDYIVQERELTPDRFRTAFGIAILIAVITALILFALAGYAGDFYREPGITQALYVIAASFLLVPFGASTMSLLRRNLRFKDLAVIYLFGAIVQNVSGILLAWAGVGFMSLAWSSLIGVAANIIGALFYRPRDLPWLPSLREWRRILKFSSYLSGSSLLSYAKNSLSDLVFGRMISMDAVAYFNKAKGVSDLAGSILFYSASTISLPHFSQSSREGQSVIPAFVHGTTLYNTLTLPLCAVLAITAEPVIQLLYGSQWTASSPLLQILCLSAAISAPATLTRQVLVATGQVRTLFILDTQSLFITLLLVVFGAIYGLIAATWAYCLATLFTTILRMRQVSLVSGLSLSDIGETLRYSVSPAALSSVGPLLIQLYFSLPAYWNILLSGITALIGFLIGIFTSKNRVRDELALLLNKFK